MKSNTENIFDKNLFDILSKDINIPESFTSSIKTVEYEDTNHKANNSFIYKRIAVIFSIILISTNILVYAYQYIKNYKSNSSIGYVSNSIEDAIENGYIQNVDMDYVYSNNLGAKIDYIVMDDFTLNILFDFDVKNKSDITNEANIKDLIIYDENQNIIFCYNPKKYQNFCKENKIQCDKNSIEQFTNGYGMQLIELSQENNKTLYTLRSTKGFPNSKKIYIQFNKIDFNRDAEISGNWNMELTLNEQFYNRNSINYNLETENEKLDIISAKITNTLMRLTLKINNVDINNFSNIDMYIVDEYGKKYDINNIEDSMSIYKEKISATFPITIKNATKHLTLYITLDNEPYCSAILIPI